MSEKWVVASCAATFGVFRHEPVEYLEDAGCEVRINPYGRPLRPQEIVDFAADADVLVLGNDRLNASTMRRLKKLKLIVRHGAGIDGIDFRDALEAGIMVANTPGANAEETADLTFGLILDLERKITQSVNSLRSGVWEKACGRSLFGKTIGIIGVGDIGMAVARRAMGFGMDIIGNDIVQRNEAAAVGLLYTSLNDLISRADIISIHAPLTSATKNLIGAKELRLMKKEAVLVNTARAGIVRSQALEKALLAGQLAGYATDVPDKEPPNPSALFELPNVLVTPHIGSATYEANYHMGMAVAHNIIAAKDGRRPPNLLTYADQVRFS